jgi:hypothetical protein
MDAIRESKEVEQGKRPDTVEPVRLPPERPAEDDTPRGAGEVDPATWSDPENTNPYAEHAKVITGYRSADVLVRMGRRPGSQISQDHIAPGERDRPPPMGYDLVLPFTGWPCSLDCWRLRMSSDACSNPWSAPPPAVRPRRQTLRSHIASPRASPAARCSGRLSNISAINANPLSQSEIERITSRERFTASEPPPRGVAIPG